MSSIQGISEFDQRCILVSILSPYRLRYDNRKRYPLDHLSFLLEQLMPMWMIEEHNRKMNNVALSDYKASLYIDINEQGKKFNTQIHAVNTGSIAQGLSVPVYSKPRARKSITDVDFMLVFESFPVGKCTIIDTVHTSPGYLKLLHDHDICGDRQCKWNQLLPRDMPLDQEHFPKRAYLHRTQMNPVTSGTSTITVTATYLEKKYADFTKNTQQKTTGPAGTSCFDSVDVDDDGMIPETDIVHALTCPDWPTEALEWQHRLRHTGWPKPSVVKEILSGGCHIVPTSPINDDSEWRFSFACAETTLSRSLSPRQRQCFIIFKLLASSAMSPCTAISTYCLKNVMLWAMERVPPSVFEDKDLGVARGVLYLLDELILHLAKKYIPHYFIPSCNLLHKKTSIEGCRSRIIHLRENLFDIVVDFACTHRGDHVLTRDILQPLVQDAKQPTNYMKFRTKKIQCEFLILRGYASRSLTHGFKSLNRQLSDDPHYDRCLRILDLPRSPPCYAVLKVPPIIPEPRLRSLKCSLAWSTFVTYIDEADRGIQNLVFGFVQQIFKDGLRESTEDGNVCIHILHHAMFIAYAGQDYQVAIDELHMILDIQKSWADNSQKVYVDTNSNPLINPKLRAQLTKYGAQYVPIVFMTLYELAKCYQQQGKLSKVRDTLQHIEQIVTETKCADDYNWLTVGGQFIHDIRALI